MRAFKSSIFVIVVNKNMATGFIDDYRWTIPQAWWVCDVRGARRAHHIVDIDTIESIEVVRFLKTLTGI